MSTAGTFNPVAVKRRGQAEIIGGLIVLTIIFLIAVPLLLQIYRQAADTAGVVSGSLTEALVSGNEKVSIDPLNPADPDNQVYVDLGWYPAVVITNQGTVSVDLLRMYLIDLASDRIVMAFDMTTLRPEVLSAGHVIKALALNPTPVNPQGEPLPPQGRPITLAPGDTLLVAFNILNPENYAVVVESSRGVIHPVVGVGEEGRLVPEAPGEGVGQGAGGSLLRPIFAPLNGFRIESGPEMARYGDVIVWRPRIEVRIPDPLPYSATFIYDDPDPGHTGLQLIYIKSRSFGTIEFRGANLLECEVTPNDEIYIHGLVGTYQIVDSGVYVRGFALKVEVIYLFADGSVQDEPCVVESNRIVYGNSSSVRFDFDFDGNGKLEMTVFSLLNSPTTISYNLDADSDGSVLRDAVVWTYVVARDISDSDYIRVTGKVNYYWTATYTVGCPSEFRPLKTFSIAVFKFDEVSGKWVLEQWRDFFFEEEKPRQYLFTVVFPIERTGIYRVGIIFYDNYVNLLVPSFFGYISDCYIDFTYATEFLDIEYGIVNPLLEETPPVYVIAIPDPALISGLGEESYAAATGVTIDQAKLEIQSMLLDAIDYELNVVGIGSYVLIDSIDKLCNVLFPDQVSGNIVSPPRNAIVFWLQGDVGITDITLQPGSPCVVTESELSTYIADYGWIFVQATGIPFWGSPSAILGRGVASLVEGGDASITDEGSLVRIKYGAYAMPDVITFATLISTTTAGENRVLREATFYVSTSGDYGHVAFTMPGSDLGVYIAMHIVPDWSANLGFERTIAQIATFSAIEAYAAVNPG